MNFIIQLLISSLTSFLVKLLTSFASEKVFAYAMFKILRAGVKSTKTEWDDELLNKIEEHFNADK